MIVRGSLLRNPRIARRLAVLPWALVVVLALVAASSASGSRFLRLGLMDEDRTLFANPPTPTTLAVLDELRPEVLRVNLYWHRVAPTMPADAANPGDQAYDWAMYDRLVTVAQQHGIELVFSILGTPSWASGGSSPERRAPARTAWIRAFAYAAATRYSGNFDPDGSDPDPALPRVRFWTAWNEPNLGLYLIPQYQRIRGRKVYVAPRIYSKSICNPIWRGIHDAGTAQGVSEKVACGVTSPGRRSPPIRFLRGMKRAKARFDVFAHHPHPTSRFETPTSRSRGGAIGLGNIGELFREFNRLYNRRIRLWITEYAYQTNPPDRFVGVSFRKQRRYLRQAYSIVRRHPRIDMLIWFQLYDEPDLNGSRFGVPGWQAGLLRLSGTAKPSYYAFKNLPR